jgi:peptide deformylase
MQDQIVTIESSNQAQQVLRLKTNKIKFPLSKEDKDLIAMMKEIIVSLKGVGLAAPQVAINKNIAVIYIPESAALLRDNAVEQPLHVIINADYEPLEDEGTTSDFEGCYSVKSVMGKVPRYNVIRVRYQDEEGSEIVKIEKGFYARVLQHEIDHLNGLLITDRLTPECIQGTPQEMLEIRRRELPEEKKVLFDKLISLKNLAIEE